MKRLILRGGRKLLVWHIFIASTFLFLLPQADVLAQTPPPIVEPEESITINIEPELPDFSYQLPVNKIKILKKIKVEITAYNAVPEQTDSTPCLTADGTNVCSQPQIKVVAANWLPFGTKVRIPEYFGDTVFEVHDRMNPRYKHRLDVLMDSIPEAKKFGKRTLTVEILN